MAFNFSSCCFARGPHQRAHIWLRLTYLLDGRAMKYLRDNLQTVPISASIKMHPKEEPKGCRSKIWSLGRARSRAEPPSPILIDSCFILHILSTQDDNIGRNPLSRTEVWHRHAAVIWWRNNQKEVGCVFGAFFSLFICSYVSSQICSSWFAILLSAAPQMLQVCSSRRLSDQVSATSCFGLLQNHKRGSHLAVRKKCFQLPSLLVHFSTHGFFWIRGWKWRAPNPKAAARRSPACPSYWHLVPLYQLLIKQCSRTVCAN